MNMLRKMAVAVAVVLLVGSVYAEYVPFKVSLTPAERLNVLNILPKEGNIITIQSVRRLEEELRLTVEEQVIMEFEIDPNTGNILNLTKPADNGGIKWDKVPEKEFTFGDLEKGVVVGALKKLDKQEKLPVYMLSIYEKFVGVE